MAPPFTGNLTRRINLEGYETLQPERFKDALKGQTVIVTGAGRGIGKQTALRLCEAGANVAFFARSHDAVTTAAEEGRKYGVKTLAVAGDMTKHADLERLVDETERHLGPVDYLCNVAGYNTFEPFVLSEQEDWWNLVTLNLKGPVDLVRLLLPKMIKRGKGRFMFVTSVAIGFPLPYTAHYLISKGALHKLIEVLKAETEMKHPEANISFFCVHPGEVHTFLHEQLPRPRVQKEAPEVGQMLDRMHASQPPYTADLCGMTAVWLGTGAGDAMSGRFIDASRDVGELMGRIDEIKAKDMYTLRMTFL